MHKVIVKCIDGWSDARYYLDLTDCQKRLLDYLVKEEVINLDNWSILCTSDEKWEEV